MIVPDCSWLRRLVLPVLMTFAMAGDARSHTEGHGEPILLTFVGAERLVDGRVEVELEIRNAGAHAATLRGATTYDADRVVISRIRHLLGQEIANPINNLRIEPGKFEHLAPPDYQIMIEGLAADKTALTIDLDFGPLGTKTLPITVRR